MIRFTDVLGELHVEFNIPFSAENREKLNSFRAQQIAGLPTSSLTRSILNSLSIQSIPSTGDRLHAILSRVSQTPAKNAAVPILQQFETDYLAQSV